MSVFKKLCCFVCCSVVAHFAVADDKPRIDVPEEFVYVCQDGGAGGYEAFPDVCRLADGRLLAVFYAGYAHISFPNEKLPNGGRVSGCWSSDEGKTWSEPVTMIDTPIDDRDPSLTQLADGRLLLNFFTYEEIDNVITIKTYIAESTDGGQSWSEPRKLFENYPCTSPIRVLSDGTLVFPLYDDINGQETRGAVSLSNDGGKTWSDPINIPNGGIILDAETDVIELKNGDLWAIQRRAMAWSVSHDKGKTWSASEKLGFPGHCPYLLRVKDDIILLATRCHEAATTNIYASRDECKTWSEAFVVDKCMGAYPSMVTLNDGSVLIAYYEEGYRSSIRAKRVTVNP
ncbi:MAG: sialidase family protein [Planctomycetia bacterium]|nr:sialidase family protein [Planctomycetia bacterium]